MAARVAYCYCENGKKPNRH